MPLYKYRAFTSSGKKVAGAIEADTLAAAKERLTIQKLIITSLSAKKEGSTLRVKGSSHLLTFTRDLKVMISAGLPLYDALVLIDQKYRRHPLQPLIADLCNQMKAGESFSKALSCYPQVFSPLYLSMIRSAEKSGALLGALSELYDLLERSARLKKQLSSSLMYPAFLGVFCLVIVIALFFFIIPSMQDLFEGRALHPMTEVTLAISSFLKGHQTEITATCALGAFFIILSAKSQKITAKVFIAAHKAPFIGRLLLEVALLRFFRAMHMLLSGGVSLYESLSLASESLGNPLLAKVAKDASASLLEGGKLSQALAVPILPGVVPRMVAIAEETAEMEKAMDHLAVVFQEDLDKDLQQLMTWLQPAVLLVLGIVVGFVILSILLPLTDVGSFLAE
jgi:general secretion pathway protein F